MVVLECRADHSGGRKQHMPRSDRLHRPRRAERMRTCLVVDDSRVVRKLARRILEGGYEVAEAEDGSRALAACRAAMPDCVLLDWNMPVMNGIEFLRALRAEFGPDEPAVVLCTTENDFARSSKRSRAARRNTS